MEGLILILKLQLLFVSPIFGQSYLEIPPVKLLTVGSVANRFPAAGSVESGGYRTSIENGFVSNCAIRLFESRSLYTIV